MPLIDNGVGISSPAYGPITPLSAVRGLGGPNALPDANWVRLRQPWLDSMGRACVTINDLNGGYTKQDSNGGEPKPLLRSYLVNDLRNMGYPVPMVTNATSLRPRDWIQMDTQVVRAFRQRLRATADLESASSYGGFNAMGRMTLEYQAMSDPGEAVVDMDARTDGRNDLPNFILRSLPLPITHSDFGYSQRELMVSRNGDSPLDTVLAEAGARRVAESIEDQVIGNVTGVTYGTQSTGISAHTGTSTVYGYTNFPQRLTKSNFTVPTTTNGPTTYAEILAALDQLYAQFFYGQFIIYHSIDWTQYMNSPFSLSGGNNPGETLRSMLLKIPDIQDVRRLDRLTSTFTLIIVSMQSDVAQLINGMDITTVQWEEKGGLELRFKVMAIKVPRLRSDYNSRTGILHGTTA
jgi:uncharacterized linocin/CFP29 family protein